jgi:hypothetical protein
MAEARSAVEEVASRHGLTVEKIRSSYNQSEIGLRIALTVTGSQGDRERSNFDSLCSLCGLKPEHFRANVEAQREAYVLVGFRPNARKRPVLLQRVRDGQQFVFPKVVLEQLYPR